MMYAEQDTQMKFIKYCDMRKIRHNHSANEGRRTAQEGNKLKRMGMSKGFPDVEIPLPNQNYSGLYIEFKSLKGRATPEQTDWLAYLNDVGYKAVICRSLAEAQKVLDAYLEDL